MRLSPGLRKTVPIDPRVSVRADLAAVRMPVDGASTETKGSVNVTSASFAGQRSRPADLTILLFSRKHTPLIQRDVAKPGQLVTKVVKEQRQACRLRTGQGCQDSEDCKDCVRLPPSPRVPLPVPTHVLGRLCWGACVGFMGCQSWSAPRTCPFTLSPCLYAVESWNLFTPSRWFCSTTTVSAPRGRGGGRSTCCIDTRPPELGERVAGAGDQSVRTPSNERNAG